MLSKRIAGCRDIVDYLYSHRCTFDSCNITVTVVLRYYAAVVVKRFWVYNQLKAFAKRRTRV